MIKKIFNYGIRTNVEIFLNYLFISHEEQLFSWLLYVQTHQKILRQKSVNMKISSFIPIRWLAHLLNA